MAAHGTDGMEEMVDVVDSEDRVVGTAPRKGIHKTSIVHRSVHVFLICPDGRIWLERRADTTDTFPGYYNSSAAGHVRSGESYLQGAEREAEEELGIPGLRLVQRHKLTASDATSMEFVAFFTATSDARPRAHEDAKSLEAFTVNRIESMIREGKRFTPIFLALFEWYRSNPV